jgi:hypothetical protein
MASVAVGRHLKERLAAYLRQEGFQVEDYGNGAVASTPPTSPPRSPRRSPGVSTTGALLVNVRLHINREPPVTAIVLWTPSAEQQDRKDELMQGGPYDIALPNGESWRMAPEKWQETPEGKVAVTLRSNLPRPHGPDGTPFELDMEAGATEAEKREVSQVFRSIGFEPGDIRLMERRGLGDYPWLVTVSLPLAIFLKSFLEQAGKDAAEALRDLIKRIFKARESSGQDGQFILIDEDSGIRLTILGELSVKACRKLLELDPSQLGDQYNALVYNEETGEWELW